MGQRSQIYVKINTRDQGDMLIASYFGWNYGTRMVSRAMGIMEWLNAYKDYPTTFQYNSQSHEYVNNAKKLQQIMATNFDMRDVAESADIIKEYESGLYRKPEGMFLEQDNNDGQLLIDARVDWNQDSPAITRLKYAFLDNEGKYLGNAEKYLEWNEKGWRKSKHLTPEEVEFTEKNIKSISELAEVMDPEDVSVFIRWDYIKDMGIVRSPEIELECQLDAIANHISLCEHNLNSKGQYILENTLKDMGITLDEDARFDRDNYYKFELPDHSVVSLKDYPYKEQLADRLHTLADQVDRYSNFVNTYEIDNKLARANKNGLNLINFVSGWDDKNKHTMLASLYVNRLDDGTWKLWNPVYQPTFDEGKNNFTREVTQDHEEIYSYNVGTEFDARQCLIECANYGLETYIKEAHITAPLITREEQNLTQEFINLFKELTDFGNASCSNGHEQTEKFIDNSIRQMGVDLHDIENGVPTHIQGPDKTYTLAEYPYKENAISTIKGILSQAKEVENKEVLEKTAKEIENKDVSQAKEKYKASRDLGTDR